MTNFVEHISTIDGACVKTSKQKALKDNSMIKGFVTMIKNEGRADEQILCKDKPNLLTDTGRDYAIAQFYTNTSAGGVGCNFIALTVNTAAASASSTTLTGEITTNGLERLLATTITHVSGTNSTTLNKIFTASGTHTAVQKSATFNQLAVGGQMGHEAIFTPVTLSSSDTLSVTWTLTLG
jgi:hypothetical protein